MSRDFLLSIEQRKEIAHRYRNRERAKDLAEEYGVEINTIYYAIRSVGESATANFRNLTTDQIKMIRDLKESGLSSYQIANLYGVSRPAICAHLRMNEDQRRFRGDIKRKYNFNEDFFSSISDERQAYWLGMLVSDGTIDKHNKVVISLTSKDREHLIKFATDLNATNPVLDYHYPDRNPPIHKSMLTLNSSKMVKDLKQYGVVPNKTFVTIWPLLDTLLVRHFVRGLTDGDGTFYVSGKNNIGYSILGSKIIVFMVQTTLIENCTVRALPLMKHPKSKDIFSCRYEGNRQVIRIANYLYKDATVYLERKRKKVLDHYQSLPKYRDLLEFG